MNLMNFKHLAKILYVSIGIFKRFTRENREHTHYMEIYSKILALLWGREYKRQVFERQT